MSTIETIPSAVDQLLAAIDATLAEGRGRRPGLKKAKPAARRGTRSRR